MRYPILASLLAAITFSATLAAHPETAKKPVTDELQGVKIVDDYRWLEDWNDKSVQDWSERQNVYARSMLDKIACAPALRARLTELEHSVGVEYHAVKPVAGMFFASKNQPPRQQPLIVVLKSMDDLKSERVILDPNTLDKEGHTSFDWFVPSPDGKYLAVSLSEGGSESGNVHIYNVADGTELKSDMVPRVNGGTAGGSMAWTADGRGFFYTRYPRDGERPEKDMAFYTQVWFHAMGSSTDKDIYETGKDYPKIAEIALEVSPDGNWVLANVQNGDGGEFIQDFRCLNSKSDPDNKRAWTRLTKWDDRIVEAKFGPDSAAYLVSRKDAPMGKILRLPLAFDAAPALASAKTIIPEQKAASIETAFSERNGLWITKSRVYVLYQVGGPNDLRGFDHAGREIGGVPHMDVSTIGGVDSFDAAKSDDLAYSISSFVEPATYFRYQATETGGGSVRTAMAVTPPPGVPPLTVKRDFATSKDGTKVPVNIIMRADLTPDAKSGGHPTIVWGYGGYGVNEAPGFSPRRICWIEQGGIFVVANIRGGGEYGEQWHLKGNLLNKQNVFDDFYAACKFMVDQNWTSTPKLGIFGGSNGGLLMGATLTQHPEMFKAVVSSVGIYDMLRVELSSNGEFNITEFGTVKNSEQFKALYAYSPYHHVTDGTMYPALLMLTGANDPRVDPMQSRKFTARLQAASPDGITLLRTSGNTGHGMRTPLAARIEQSVDTYGFFFEQLGLAYRAIKTKK